MSRPQSIGRHVTASRNGLLGGLGPFARWCLVAGTVEPSGDLPIGSDLERESDLIIREGLTSVAFRALRTLNRDKNEPYVKLLRRFALAAEMRSVAADVAGSKVLAQLEAQGIPVAVVKGPAVARLHPEGWPRPYADIDVVVPRARYLDAISCAENLGFVYSERAVPQWRWFDLICREGINLHTPTGGNIDIHHHLPPWVLGSHLPVQTIIHRSQKHDLSGIPVPFAVAEDLLVVTALHILNDLWKGKLGLTSWRDVIVIIKGIGEDQSRKAFDQADLGWLFDVIVDELRRSVPDADLWSAGPHTTPLGARLRLAALGWSNDSSPTRHRLAWATRLPPLNALAFLVGVAFPSGEYIRTRHGSYVNYWRRSLQETISTARGSDFRMRTIDDNGS